MPSGEKRVIINLRERAVSTDINRAQAFLGAGLGEVLRYLLNVSTEEDDTGNGVATEHLTLGTPLSAEILSGLMVRPQNGSLSLLVDPGVICSVTPDGDADSSVYKITKDPGVLTVGLLLMTANGSGSPRIDVIEVQVSDVITETDSRDLFDPATGLFTASTVNKAGQSTCTFVGGATNIRVRLGTPGSGYPGAVSGWMPICIALVPSGSGVNDTMTFWDVRPLVNDRAYGLGNTSNFVPRIESQLDATTYPNANGYIRGIFSGRRIGGRLRRGSPGTDNAFLNWATDATNASPGWSVSGTGTMWSMYLMFPFGLPRWSRYRDASFGARVPRAPRGIPVITDVLPDTNGSPSASVPLPTSLGLGSVSSLFGVCVMSMMRRYTSQVWYTARDWVYWPSAGGNDASNTPPDAVSGTGDDQDVDFTLAPATEYPSNVSAVRISAAARFTSTSTEDYRVSNRLIANDDGATHFAAQTHGTTFHLSITSGNLFSVASDIETPIANSMAGSPGNAAVRLTPTTTSTTPLTLSASKAWVTGYRISNAL